MSREVCGQCNGEVTDIGCHCEPTQVNEIERLRAENAALRVEVEQLRSSNRLERAATDHQVRLADKLRAERDALRAEVADRQQAWRLFNEERETTTALRAERDALRAERDKYRDILFARNGGDPLALLDELDEALSRADALHAALTECVEMLDWIGSSCEGYDATMQTVDEKRQRFLALLAAPKEKSK